MTDSETKNIIRINIYIYIYIYIYISDYNLEFYGSIWNLQKKYIFREVLPTNALK